MTDYLHTDFAIDKAEGEEVQGPRLPLLRGRHPDANNQDEAKPFSGFFNLTAHDPCFSGQISALYTSEAIQRPVAFAREQYLHHLHDLSNNTTTTCTMSFFLYTTTDMAQTMAS